MFYSQVILAKKGPLGKVWLAAHFDKKLTKQQIFSTDITASVNSILNPATPLALRVSGHLMLGIVRIYSKKVKYLMSDCTEAMWKMKLAFRPGKVDIDPSLLNANIDDAKFFGNIPNDSEFPVLDNMAFSSQLLPYSSSRESSVPGTPMSAAKLGRKRAKDSTPYAEPFPISSPLSATQSSRISDVQFVRERTSLPPSHSKSDLVDRRNSSLGGNNMKGDDELPAFDADLLTMDNFLDFNVSQGSANAVRTSLNMQPDDQLAQTIDFQPVQDHFFQESESMHFPEDKSNRMEVVEEGIALHPATPLAVVDGDEKTREPSSRPPRKKQAIELSTNSFATMDAMPPPAKRKPILKSRVHIDERVELSDAVLKQRMKDVAPTLRRRVDDPLPFQGGNFYEQSALDTLEQRLDIFHDLSSELHELAQIATNSLPFPFPLKKPRLTEETSRIDTSTTTIMQTPIAATEKSAISAATAGDMNLPPSASFTVDGGVSSIDMVRHESDFLEPKDPSQLSFLQDEPIVPDMSFDYMQGFQKDRVSDMGAVFQSVQSNQPTEEPMEMIPTELSKRVQELIQSTEGKVDIDATGKETTKQFVSERSKGIYSLVNELFTQQEHTTFQELVSGCSKTTAARCFLEVLQLKTANKIGVQQEKAFGMIGITPVTAVA